MENLALFLQLLLIFDLLLSFPELVVSEIDVLRSKKMHLFSVSVGKKIVGYCLEKINSGFSSILKMALIFILWRKK